MTVHALDPSAEDQAAADAFARDWTEKARERRAKLKYPVRTIQELSFLPKPKNWLVKGLLAQGETSAWIAPPGGMKSALMAELTMCVANQQPWHGRKVDRCHGVIYFALERSDLVHRRLMAHCLRMELSQDDRDQMPVMICPAMIDLTAGDCVQHVMRSINELGEEYGIGPSLLIFDTFAKLIAAGGGDEDKAKDQGRVFANVQRIKDACHGPHVALVGHTGKDETRGSRGSNAFLGDVDVMVTISGGEIKTATVVKANDMPEGPLFSFKSIVHEFGLDEDGDPITVNVVSNEAITAPVANDERPKLTANQKTVFAMLHAAGGSGLTLENWNNLAKDAGIGVKRKADLTDIRNALLSKGMIRQSGERWMVRHD